MAYEKTVFVPGQAPAYDSAQELNKVQQGIFDAHTIAESAKPITGTYTGTTSAYTDNTTWQTINLGFRPTVVFVVGNNGALGDDAFSGMAINGSNGSNIEILNSGFRVKHHLNAIPTYYSQSSAISASPGIFKYLAFK